MAFAPLLIAAQVAGGALSAIGSINKGNAENAAAQYNAAVDQNRAAASIDASNAEASDYTRKSNRTIESGIALQGAQGVTSEGSPLLVDASTVREAALGAARIRTNGQAQAVGLGNDATLQKFKGENAQTAGYIGAASSLLTTAGRLGGVNGWGSGPTLNYGFGGGSPSGYGNGY